MGTGVAILIAAPEGDLDGRDHPQATFYRQDNDFFYLTGIESPGAWLALVARDSVLAESILFLPPLDTLYERWWGRRLAPTPEATTITGIKDVRSAVNAESDVRRVIAQTGRGGRSPTLLAKRGSAERANRFLGETVSSLPGLRLEDLSPLLAVMRLVKDDDEIARIGRATEISVDGHLVRTIPVDGKFSAKQRAVYDVVLGAQQTAIDSIRPGVTLGRLTAIAREYMRARSGTACGTVTCDAYFLHSLSHWLGMDTHDVGAYNVPLAAGMVFTVEPGVVMAADGFRIGIGDVVLVTPNGHEVFSSRLPREPGAIEAFLAKRRAESRTR